MELNCYFNECTQFIVLLKELHYLSKNLRNYSLLFTRLFILFLLNRINQKNKNVDNLLNVEIVHRLSQKPCICSTMFIRTYILLEQCIQNCTPPPQNKNIVTLLLLRCAQSPLFCITISISL